MPNTLRQGSVSCGTTEARQPHEMVTDNTPQLNDAVQVAWSGGEICSVLGKENYQSAPAGLCAQEQSDLGESNN